MKPDLEKGARGLPPSKEPEVRAGVFSKRKHRAADRLGLPRRWSKDSHTGKHFLLLPGSRCSLHPAGFWRRLEGEERNSTGNYPNLWSWCPSGWGSTPPPNPFSRRGATAPPSDRSTEVTQGSPITKRLWFPVNSHSHLSRTPGGNPAGPRPQSHLAKQNYEDITKYNHARLACFIGEGHVELTT